MAPLVNGVRNPVRQRTTSGEPIVRNAQCPSAYGCDLRVPEFRNANVEVIFVDFGIGVHQADDVVVFGQAPVPSLEPSSIT